MADKYKNVAEDDKIELIHCNNIDVDTRTVYLMDEVTDLLASELVKNLLYLDFQSNEEIRLIICSPGGEVQAGMAIYDAIKALDSPVTAILVGHASSMASIIPQACTKRLIANHTLMVLHEGSSGAGGHVRDVEAHGDWLKRERDVMYSVYMEAIARSGKKVERKELERLIRNDCYLTAQQVIEYGLADAIVEKWNVKRS